jgi:hypothetical protein
MERQLTPEQKAKLQDCLAKKHELKEEEGWIHCLTCDEVIGPSHHYDLYHEN